MPAAVRIDIPAFAGPFDLLLHLIERQELDITAISLAQVTDQYLAQVELLGRHARVEELIDFIVVGARLAQIKSRALLPVDPELPADEEEEDPAEALARQLRAYRRFKSLAAWLGQREAKGWRTYLRVAPPPVIEPRLDLSGLSVESLAAALRQALARVRADESSVSLVVRRRITVEGQMALLRQRVAARQPFAFVALLSERTSVEEVCVTLLAVLELIKRGEIGARQAEPFGPVLIEPVPAAQGA